MLHFLLYERRFCFCYYWFYEISRTCLPSLAYPEWLQSFSESLLMHISWIILPSTLPCSSFRSNVAVIWLRMSSLGSDIWTSYVSHGGPICIFSAWPCWRNNVTVGGFEISNPYAISILLCVLCLQAKILRAFTLLSSTLTHWNHQPKWTSISYFSHGILS